MYNAQGTFNYSFLLCTLIDFIVLIAIVDPPAKRAACSDNCSIEAREIKTMERLIN